MRALFINIQIWLGLIFRPKSKKINDYLIRKFNEELNRRLNKFYDEVDLDTKDIELVQETKGE